MKSAIVYYSYSGNTKQVAETLAEYLRAKGEVACLRIKPLDEPYNFFKQGARAFKRVRAKISEPTFDLSGYDLICLGSPVWAFGPAPAMNTYLDDCQGVANKEVILFYTYGSGLGKERCADYMQELLTKKGVTNLKRFSVQQIRVKDKEYVLSAIKKII